MDDINSAKTLHVLTEPTRYSLIRLLQEHHYCVSALAIGLGISESAVSQHLSILKKHNIVTGVRIGYHIHYHVNVDILNDVFGTFAESFCRYPDLDNIKVDLNCACEFIADCTKRDQQLLEKQGYLKTVPCS